MAAKTFIPALVKLVTKLCEYLTKHGATIESTLGAGSPEWAAVVTMNSACTAFTAIIRAARETP